MRMDHLVDMWYAAAAEHPPKDGDEGDGEGILTIIACKDSVWWEFSVRKCSRKEAFKLETISELEEEEYSQHPDNYQETKKVMN